MLFEYSIQFGFITALHKKLTYWIKAEDLLI
jgi:hypothetical protein